MYETNHTIQNYVNYGKGKKKERKNYRKLRVLSVKRVSARLTLTECVKGKNTKTQTDPEEDTAQ